LESRHIHVSSRRTGRGHADIALGKLGHKRKIAMRVQHYLVAARVAVQNDLLWTVPRGLAEQLPLLIKPLPFEVQFVGSSLYWHSSTEQDPASIWMRELIADLPASA
jgi:DNA-binding transcriptional LysR family regulator